MKILKICSWKWENIGMKNKQMSWYRRQIKMGHSIKGLSSENYMVEKVVKAKRVKKGRKRKRRRNENIIFCKLFKIR